MTISSTLISPKSIYYDNIINTLRKYEGKPGDTKGAMLGGILQMVKNLPTSPEHIERYVESLFDWVLEFNVAISHVGTGTRSKRFASIFISSSLDIVVRY